MKLRHLAPLSALFCLTLLGSHVQASVPAEDYWQSLWPNTAMPKALAYLTHPDGRTHAKIGNTEIDVDVYATLSDNTKLENVTFFFEHELHAGKKYNLEFTKPSYEFTFLPDTVARTAPFSSARFPEILNRYNIEPDSAYAETVKFTLDLCENPAINGEEKYCATSLESLVNFAVSKLGKNIKLLSTELEKQEEEETVQKKTQEYTVEEGVKKSGDKAVVCHKLNYPFAVFYCHKVDSRAYAVPLVATSDGTKVKAFAVCHIDTANWASENPAFQQLNVKPGTVTVCHFLATDTLLWVPN